MTDEQRKRKALAEETYKAVEGFWTTEGSKLEIDTSDWPEELRESFENDVLKLAAEKNLPVEVAAGVLTTAALRAYWKDDEGRSSPWKR